MAASQRPRLPIFLLLVISLAFAVDVRPTHAASVVGSGTAASCTEAAFQAAVQNGGTITFNCGGAATITVSDDVRITKDSVIDGGGTQQGGLITISGGNTTRALISSNQAALTVRNLTIRDGKEGGTDGRGGAIRGCWRCPITIVNSRFENNDGTAGAQEGGGGAIFVHASTLTVQDSAFVGNRGINGGAINNLLSGLSVVNSTFTNNDATLGGSSRQGYGGAIYTDGASEYTNDAVGGAIVIRNSTFSGNRGAGQGGAVFSFVYSSDVVTVDRSAFAGNSVVPNAAGDALGGGLRHGNGQLLVTSSTFSENIAHGQGGGLWSGENSPVQVINSTFSGNRAESADGKSGLGGAIAIPGGTWTITSTTIANNHAGYMGGGIFGGGPGVTLRNTIVANNTATNGGNSWNIKIQCSGTLTDGGNNLQFPAKNPNDSTDTNCTSSIRIADPLLATLAANGGATPTRALLQGSPAIDAGNPQTCPSLDQRSYVRMSRCDIGAYELGGAPFVPTSRTLFPIIRR